jgi:hypothetical protein
MDRETLLKVAACPSFMLEVPERNDPYLEQCSEEERMEIAMYRAGMTDPDAYGPTSGNLGNVHF